MSDLNKKLILHQQYTNYCNVPNRTIFCRDNIDILQNINSECVDLIYLDPPFNTKQEFTAPTGSNAEGASFKDIFRKEDLKDEWVQTIKEDHYSIHELLNAVKNIEGRTSYNFCYLAYMAIRLIEMHRILKSTGSVYLHCDSTMSHYLKLTLDCIFGEKNFKNEVVWGYSTSGRARRGRRYHWAKKHDIILWYTKNIKQAKADCTLPCTPEYIASHYTQTDAKGQKCRKRVDAGKERVYYPEEGMNGNDWWGDIPYENSISATRTDYPTQKPLPLLDRIIKSSSNEGDVVLDPFCGCATTCVAAEKLGRHWIGIDISNAAYELVRQRLKKEVWNNPDALHAYEGKYPDINYLMSPPKRTDTDDGMKGRKYVYVISHPNYAGEYKVGIASNYNSRLNSYQTSDPDRKYKLEHQVHTEHYRELERHIHAKFKNKHEWVEAKLEDVIDEINKYQSKPEESLFDEPKHN